jgi:penicillin amidase
MLTAREKLTVEDFKAMQLDQYSKLAEKTLPVFLAALREQKNLTPLESHALKILSDWNYFMDSRKSAPLIFESLYWQFIRCTYSDEMGDQLYQSFLGVGSISRSAADRIIESGASEWFDDISTPEQAELLKDIVGISFSQTVASLESKLGDNPETWEWGQVHRLALAHPLSAVKILDKVFNLSRGPYPVGGSFHTVCPFGYSSNKPFEVNHGASHRHIYDLSDWDQSLTVIPTGNSGIPSSQHYCDQTNLYIHGKYHADPFSKEKVVAGARYHMTFKSKP